MASKRAMVASFKVEDGRIKLRLTTRNFPPNDFAACVDLLRAELEKEKQRIVSEQHLKQQVAI